MNHQLTPLSDMDSLLSRVARFADCREVAYAADWLASR